MNNKNLIPLSERSQRERKEIAAMGAAASNEKKRRKKDMKAKLKLLLELPCVDIDDFNEAVRLGVDMEEIDNETAMLIGLFNKAKSGDVQAVREVRSILGKDNASAELELKKRELKLKEKSHDASADVLEKLDEVLGGIESAF